MGGTQSPEKEAGATGSETLRRQRKPERYIPQGMYLFLLPYTLNCSLWNEHTD